MVRLGHGCRYSKHMGNIRIVAKAMNDLADDWHWLILHDAEQIEPQRYLVSSAGTACGLLVVDRPRSVRLYDMGAPDEPTCEQCLGDGWSDALTADLEEALRRAEEVPDAEPVATP